MAGALDAALAGAAFGKLVVVTVEKVRRVFLEEAVLEGASEALGSGGRFQIPPLRRSSSLSWALGHGPRTDARHGELVGVFWCQILFVCVSR